MKRVTPGFFVAGIALLSVAAGAAGDGWPQEREGSPNGGQFTAPILERYGDAPYTTNHISQFGGVGGGGGSTYGAYHSVQVNVNAQGNNILGDAANEPSLAVDPTNPKHIAIGWRQFDSVNSNFRQGGWGYTTNGGLSWTFPGNLEPGVFRSDPVLATTSEGKFFYLSLQQTFYDDEYVSNNGGTFWNLVGPATGGDKQWQTIDKSSGPSHGFIYQVWSTGGNNWNGRDFSRSMDGGKTWMDPIYMPNQPFWGTLDIGIHGELFVGGFDGVEYVVDRSSNAGVASQTPVFELSQPVNLGGTQIFGGYVNPGGLSGQTWIAVDKSRGPTRGYVYMLCSVFVDNANPCDVMFARSRDGGVTWDPPQRINDDQQGTGASHWFATLAVSPNGRIDVVWNDTRDDITSNTSALYYCQSQDGGSHWSKNVRVSQSFNQFVGYPNQQKMGDYMGVVSDNSGANVAYSATFNNEEDIYFLRIPATTGAIVVPADTVAMFEGASSTGTVQDIRYADGSTFNVLSKAEARVGQVAAHVETFTLPSQNVNFIRYQVNASGPLGTTALTFIFDWNANVYRFVNAFALNPNGASNQAVITQDLAKYVGPGGKVKTLVRGVSPTRGLGAVSFMFNTDLVQLAVND